MYMEIEDKKIFYDSLVKQYQILNNMYKNLEFDLTFCENEEERKIIITKYEKLKDIKNQFIRLQSAIIANTNY